MLEVWKVPGFGTVILVLDPSLQETWLLGRLVGLREAKYKLLLNCMQLETIGLTSLCLIFIIYKNNIKYELPLRVVLILKKANT